MAPKALFHARQFVDLAEYQRKTVVGVIAQATRAQLSDPDFVNDLKSRHGLVPLALDVDSATSETSEGKDNRTNVRLTIPFTGTPNLFDVTPSRFFTTTIAGEVSGTIPGSGADGTVTFLYSELGTDPERYKSWRSSQIEQLQKWLEFINADVTQQYGHMVHAIEQAIAARLTRLQELEDFKKNIS